MPSILELLKEARRPTVERITLGGKEFFVRDMAPTQRTVYVQLVIQAAAENAAVPPHVVVAQGICNEDGTGPTQEERNAIAEEMATLSGQELQEAARKVLDLSGLTRKSQDRAEKN